MTAPGLQQKFQALVEQHRKILYKVCNSYCQKRDDREDLAQEIIIQLWRSFERFDDRCRFSTWMYRIAVREALNYRRGWFRRHVHEPVSLDEESSEPVVALATKPDGDSPYEALELAERQKLVKGALAALPVPYRAVLVLREIDEMPYDEIAEVLGIAEGTVKSRLMRGRELLRRKLAAVLGY